MFGAAVLDPFVRPGPLQAGFGRDQKVGWIGMERLGDETFGNIWPVGIGRVDEIDAHLHRSLKDGDCFGMIGRCSPDSGTRKLHRAEAESVNRDVADQECSARFGGMHNGPLTKVAYFAIHEQKRSCLPFAGQCTSGGFSNNTPEVTDPPPFEADGSRDCKILRPSSKLTAQPQLGSNG
jgi:hypothetical protein